MEGQRRHPHRASSLCRQLGQVRLRAMGIRKEAETLLRREARAPLASSSSVTKDVGEVLPASTAMMWTRSSDKGGVGPVVVNNTCQRVVLRRRSHRVGKVLTRATRASSRLGLLRLQLWPLKVLTRPLRRLPLLLLFRLVLERRPRRQLTPWRQQASKRRPHMEKTIFGT